MDVVVTNTGEQTFARRFDGASYEFPPGQAVTISEDAARHIFGFGGSDEDRQRILIRNGWQRTSGAGDPLGPEAAKKRLAAFKFGMAPSAPPPPKPKKSVAPAQQRAAEETDKAADAWVAAEVAALSAGVPRESSEPPARSFLGVRFPGKKGPLAPPAQAA